MDQRTNLQTGRFRRSRFPAGIVGIAAAGSAVAHVVAAASGPAGVMAWGMAAMGAACLACAAPMVAGRFCAARLGQAAGWAAGRAAGHLLVMSAAMILVHLALLVAPGTGGHRIHVDASGTAGPHGQFGSHEGAMLALIAVELLCLMAASAALRLSRATAPDAVRTPVSAAVEH